MGVVQRNFFRGGAILLAILLAVSTGASVGVKGGTRDPLAQYPWIYLRGEQPLTQRETLLELTAIGDTSLTRGVDPEAAFSRVESWLPRADISFANLECALSERQALPAVTSAATAGDADTGSFRLIAEPDVVQSLRQAGIDIVGLANNHTLDAAPAGLADTVRVLDAAGIFTVGAGKDPTAAGEPLILDTKGIKIAFLAFNSIPSPDPTQAGWSIAQWEGESSLAAVRRASILADTVVVSMHWGFEYDSRADPGQIEQAQALITAGADLVIGHHPHTAQELIVQERADGSAGMAALSLGNFAFDQSREEATRGLALRAFFDRGGLRAVQLLPIHAGARPVLETPKMPFPEVIHSTPRWEKVEFSCGGETCSKNGSGSSLTTLIEPSGPGSGIFHSGQIDLTGDRHPEQVILEHNRVAVFTQGKLDWQSPPEWRVLDLALGDPDDDGRGDLLLALEKPDKKGQTQSHPFIIGYRGGVYRTIWGGSPVRDPVEEVELGDVNSDGQTELIVLETERNGKGRAVTVWHWHGWGFSLDWRSPYGEYEDMRVSAQAIWVERLRK